MKLIYSLLFLFFFLANGGAQPIDWEAVIDRYTEKYQPEISPEWLFPIIFENGDGARDTIYIGQHPDSHLFGGFQPDTIYGERWIEVDTSTFQARFFIQCMGDSICELLKTDISPDFEVSRPISFFHGKLPVRMYFNTALFRSGVLPPYNPPELPQLQGQIWEHSAGIEFANWNEELEVWDNFCPFSVPVLVTDTSFFENYCSYRDSTYLGDAPGGFDFTTVYEIQFDLKPWEGQWVYTKIPLAGMLKLFPNPVRNKLIINFEETGTGAWEIFNISGKKVNSGSFQSIETLDIPVTDLENGMHCLRIWHSNNLFVEKFLILH